MTQKTLMACGASACAGALVVLLLGGQIDWRSEVRAQAPQAARPQQGRFAPPPSAPLEAIRSDELAAIDADPNLTSEERIFVRVYEMANRSVVNINTRVTKTDAFLLFDIPAEGAGSGIVIDKQGHVLTNFHVVDEAETIQVTLFDGHEYEAKRVGGDAASDIAVLKIEAPPESLFPVVFADASNLRVGQRVFAIGNPFGLERTFTTGVISSLNRTLPTRSGRTLKSIIQLDAAINPGNSGGPLLNTQGRLIGMNTAIASKTGQNTGVGFAIPTTIIERIVPQLIARGRVIRPDVGIARVFETEKGLLIAALTPGGPAERAGLRGPKVERKQRGPFVYERIDRGAADLIVQVDETPVTSADEFLTAVERHEPGEEVLLLFMRDGQRMQVRIRLASSEN
ncbi:MAG: trypsin-like peptidase domain-containing protein [Pirellulales bacterium]|nr:trypsin-like peptidase domain-containing protein [Pirellulales bacterium]